MRKKYVLLTTRSEYSIGPDDAVHLQALCGLHFNSFRIRLPARSLFLLFCSTCTSTPFPTSSRSPFYLFSLPPSLQRSGSGTLLTEKQAIRSTCVLLELCFRAVVY